MNSSVQVLVEPPAKLAPVGREECLDLEWECLPFAKRQDAGVQAVHGRDGEFASVSSRARA